MVRFSAVISELASFSWDKAMHTPFRLGRRGWLSAVLLLTVIFLSGCGDKRVPVKGTVTLDGKPVAEGSITFQPADGVGPGTGGKIKDGHYELTGPAAAVPGNKKVL